MLASGIAPLVFSKSFAAGLVGQRVLIAGAGVAGCALALHMRRLSPDAEIVLVEPEGRFFFAPSTLECLFGGRSLASAARGYDSLIRKGIKFIQGRVLYADTRKQVAETTQGGFAYTALAVASGIDLAPGEIPGLKADPMENLSPYDRKALPELQKRIAGFKGGTIVVGAPPGAVKCSPAPYEYALLLAHMLKSRDLPGRVVLIDDRPNPQPQVLAEGFAKAFEAVGDRLDLLFQETITQVDTKERIVETGMGDKIHYDLLSLIPPNRGAALVSKLGVNGASDSFAEVDSVTLETKTHENVFALGDAARTPYGFSAGAAFESARLCANGIAAKLGKPQPPVNEQNPARVRTTCYPYISPSQSMRTISRYALYLDKGEMKLHSDPDVEAAGTPENKAARQAWEKDLLAQIFEG